MTRMGCLLLLLTLAPAVLWAEDLGNLSANPFDPDSTANPFGRYGSPFSGESINNPFGAGNPLSLGCADESIWAGTES